MFQCDASTNASNKIICVSAHGEEQSRDDGDCAKQDHGYIDATKVFDDHMECGIAKMTKSNSRVKRKMREPKIITLDRLPGAFHAKRK